jgi:Tfp pilus assembly pilus retraction ATPase PilT
MEQLQPSTTLARLLDWCREQETTDLHGQADKPYSIRVHGRLSWMPVELFPPPSDQEVYEYLREGFSPAVCARIESQPEVDLSFYHGSRRYRANFSKQKGRQSFSFRTVPQQRLKLKDLQLPDSLADNSWRASASTCISSARSFLHSLISWTRC